MSDFLRIIFFFGIVVVVLFGSAGRWDLPFVWAVLGIYAAFVALAACKMDPGLKKERFHPVAGGQDRHMRAMLLPLLLTTWVVAGLDIGRFHWSDTVPVGLRIAALGGFVAALGLAFRAMSVNPFFSPVVRIQQERGHHLITGGPYQYIRHPGYLGGMLSTVCAGLAFGSWWAMAPIGACVLIFLRRLLVEDRFLHERLPGYADYAAKVRYRLVPGIW